MKEMGFGVARKHAAKLRRTAPTTGYALPVAMTLVSAVDTGPLDMVAAALAALSISFGLVVERWLFFAEARHLVQLYYGAESAGGRPPSPVTGALAP